jgi:hypothetical protein
MHAVSCRNLGAAALLSLAGLGSAALAQAPGSWVDPPTELTPPPASTGAAPVQPPAGPPPVTSAPTRSAEPAPAQEAPSRTARPELEPDDEAPPTRSARPEPSRSTPPTRTAEPERERVAPPRPRATQPARPEPAPQRAARPSEEPRSAGRAPERQPTRQEAEAPRFPQPERSAQARAAKELAIDYLDFWSDSNATALEAQDSFYAPVVRFHGRDMSARALREEKRRFVRRWPERTYRPRLDTMRTSCAGPFCTIRAMFDFRAADPAHGRASAGTGILELGVSFTGGQPAIVSESSSVIRRGQGDRTVSLEEVDD